MARRPRKKARIEIIPLIDIMFFLLACFMMVSLTMATTKSVKVNLPVAQSADPDRRPTPSSSPSTPRVVSTSTSGRSGATSSRPNSRAFEVSTPRCAS